MRFKRLKVKSYSGFKGDKRPVSFLFAEKEYRVREIIDRWIEGSWETGKPFVYYFRVAAETDDIFLLRFDPATGDRHVWIG